MLNFNKWYTSYFKSYFEILKKIEISEERIDLKKKSIRPKCRTSGEYFYEKTKIENEITHYKKRKITFNYRYFTRDRFFF